MLNLNRTARIVQENVRASKTKTHFEEHFAFGIFP
jgi:hypothetical protein